MHGEYKIPPLTMSQYLTAGLILILMQIVFIVINNEAEVITNHREVNWINPISLLRFADEQNRLNLNEFDIQNLGADLTERKDSVGHIIIIDQTTPDIEETSRKTNYDDFKNHSKLIDRFKGCQQVSDLEAKMDTSSFHNVISYYISCRLIKGLNNGVDNLKLCLFDYNGNLKGSGDKLSAKKIKGQLIATENNLDYESACHSLLGSSLITVHSDYRTDFRALFSEIAKNYENCHKILSFGAKRNKIVITIVSDFIHEIDYRNQSESSIQSVEKAYKELGRYADGIGAINLIILPHRISDDEESDKKKSLIREISRYFQSISIPVFIAHSEYANNTDELYEILDRIHIIPPITENKPINVYYPYKNIRYSEEGRSRVKINTAVNKPALLSVEPGIGESHEKVIVQLIKNNNLEEEILETPREISVHSDTFILKVWNPAGMDHAGNMALRVSGADEQVKLFPVRFIRIISKTEAEILGLSLFFMIGLFFYWILLLLIGKAFYNNSGIHKKDTFDRLFSSTKKIVNKIRRSIPLIFMWSFLILGGVFMYLWLPSFLNFYLTLFFCSIFVGFSTYFHLRHLYRRG